MYVKMSVESLAQDLLVQVVVDVFSHQNPAAEYRGKLDIVREFLLQKLFLSVGLDYDTIQ